MYMFNEIDHQYSLYKNQELDWLTSDDEDLYLEHTKTNFNDLNEYGWINRKFTYKFNSHGFRCDEFRRVDNIAFFGCSFTCGIGLPLENTWAYHVSNNLKLKNFNLGIGSTGADTSFKLANHYIHQIQPKLVVYLEPPPGRFSINSAIFNHVCNLNVGNTDSKFKDFYNHWLSNPENSNLDYLKNKLAIEALCHRNKIKFVYAHCDEMHKIDLARDLAHPGIKSNLEFAELILRRINSELSNANR